MQLRRKWLIIYIAKDRQQPIDAPEIKSLQYDEMQLKSIVLKRYGKCLNKAKALSSVPVDSLS